MSSLPIELHQKIKHQQLRAKFPLDLFKLQSDRTPIRLFKSRSNELPLSRIRRKTEGSLFKTMMSKKLYLLSGSQKLKDMLATITRIESQKEIITEAILVKQTHNLYELIKEIKSILYESKFKITNTTTFIQYLDINDEINDIIFNLFSLYKKFITNNELQEGVLNIIYILIGDNDFNTLFEDTSQKRELMKQFRKDNNVIFNKQITSFREILNVLFSLIELCELFVFDVYFQEIKDEKLKSEIRMNVFNIMRNLINILFNLSRKIKTD